MPGICPARGVGEGEGVGVEAGVAGILCPSCCALPLMLKIIRISTANKQTRLVIITPPINQRVPLRQKTTAAAPDPSGYLRSLLFGLRVFLVATAFLS